MEKPGASSRAPLEASDSTHSPGPEQEPQETGITQKSPQIETAQNTNPMDEIPPAKPPRPLSAREQAEGTLKDAFPTIDPSVVRAVLTASNGQVEPAFNALLGMSDPDSQQEPEPPMMPPRPTQKSAASTSAAQSQLEADEQYARQLQEHYSGAAQQRDSRQSQAPRQKIQQGRQQPSEPERSFIDDDLPVIRENIRKGFLETQSTVNKWVMNLKKKIDGEEEEDDTKDQPRRPTQGYQSTPQNFGRRSGERSRRSADRDRYDADPQVLGDDFSKLELKDSDNPTANRRINRPLANPDLFRSNSGGRKVSFRDGPPDEIEDLYSAPSPVSAKPQSQSKASKWQPLSTVEPSPVAENDPFSLGDSDDEKDAKDTKAKDSKDDDAERSQKATPEVVSGDIGGDEQAGANSAKTTTKP